METLTTRVGGVLDLLFFLCLACLAAWRLWKKPLKRFVSTLSSRRSRGQTILWPTILVATVTGGLLLNAKRLNFAPIVEKYNVRVLRDAGFNQWLMEDDQGQFLYTGCDDFPNEKVIWAGYIARKARWQELGACKSIRRQDLGFWWDRDENFNAKEVH